MGAAVVLNSVLSVAYYFRIIRNMYLRESEPGTRLAAGIPITVVLVLAVISSVLFGVFPEPLVGIVSAISFTP